MANWSTQLITVTFDMEQDPPQPLWDVVLINKDTGARKLYAAIEAPTSPEQIVDMYAVFTADGFTPNDFPTG